MTELQRTEAGEVQPRPGELFRTVLTRLSDKALTPADFKECVAIAKDLEAMAAKQQFNAAMATMQPELPIISKNGVISYGVGKGSTKFARWDDIHRACMPILHAHGFSVSFTSDLIPPNALRVSVRVKHTAGHEEEGSITVPWLDQGGSKSPAQAAASSETLAMRHAFCKFFNILTADQDDDGSGKGVPERITETQAQDIDTSLTELENRKPGDRRRFMAWIKSTFQAEQIGDLFQGEQLDQVQGKLKEKLG